MLRILHLEDNLLDAELVLANLLDGGYEGEVVRVETQAEFIYQVEQFEFDLILADYSLPSFDGLTALKIARSVLPDVPFIIISGALGEETAIETLKGGATDYILKHRLERLVPAVSRALRESEERKRAARAEFALRESEERYRIVAETASDAIISVDESSKILFINRAAEKIFGYSVEEMTGKPLTMLMPHSLRPEHLAGIEHYIETGERRLDWERIEVSGLHRDGYDFPLELSFGESNQNGKRIFIGIARDVTERRQAEAERERLLLREQEARRKAEEANRLKDEFLATVSHELRTPLNAILGWASMLGRGQLNDLQAVQAIEIIERNTRAQVQLVEDLLDVSRIITGKLRLNVGDVDIVSIIESAIETVRPAAEAKSIELESDINLTQPIICGDANRIQQIVWNLLSNSVKFTSLGGKVKVSLKKTAEDVEIKISDTGAGIETDFLPFVFDRFRQADGATTRAHGGLGLGLSIVKNLAEMHGGSVRAESEGLGKGATFIVLLPQQNAATSVCMDETGTFQKTLTEMEMSNGQISKADSKLAGLNILAVDDDADSLDMLKIMLEQQGATVVVAESAADALDILNTRELDVLVSDVGMPGEDGYSLLNKVRKLPVESGGSIPAVALTGFAREEDNARALSAGFDKHVAKPVDPSALVQEIAELIKQSGN